MDHSTMPDQGNVYDFSNLSTERNACAHKTSNKKDDKGTKTKKPRTKKQNRCGYMYHSQALRKCNGNAQRHPTTSCHGI
jgi:hypothetical protein